MARRAVTGGQPLVRIDRRADDRAHPPRVGQLTGDRVPRLERDGLPFAAKRVGAVGDMVQALEDCMPEPGASASGFGMKLARSPCRCGHRANHLAHGQHGVRHPQRIRRQEIELFLTGSGFVVGATDPNAHLRQRGDHVVAGAVPSPGPVPK